MMQNGSARRSCGGRFGRLVVMVIAVTVMAAGPAPGQGWVTVDEFTSVTSRANGIGLGAGDRLVAFGRNRDASGVLHSLVRRSDDLGANWTTVADESETLSLEAAGKDGAGNLYAVGSTSPGGHWIVRKSADNGATWVTVDDYQLQAGSLAAAHCFATDSSGTTLFVGGQAAYSTKTSVLYHLIVRRSTNSGGTWQTVMDYTYPTPKKGWSASGAAAYGIVSLPGAIVVAGGAAESKGTQSFNHWIVRKSADNGSAWITVDDFTFNGGASPNGGIARDASGNLYAAGVGLAADGYYYWLVRKSALGATWSTVDQFTYSPTRVSQPAAVSSSPSGEVFISGSGNDGSSDHWITRRSADQGASWSTADDFQVSPGESSQVKGVVSDSAGNVYAAGYGFDGAVLHWVVRKLSGVPVGAGVLGRTETLFRRGDSSRDGAVDLTDAYHSLGWLFLGGPALPCPDAADANDDGVLGIADAIHTLNFLFLGGETLPYPGSAACGLDPTADDLGPCEVDPTNC